MALSFFFPSASIYWICNLLAIHDFHKPDGASWSHFWDRGFINDEVTLGGLTFDMIFSGIFYLLLVYYLAYVSPFDKGTRRSFLFPVLPLYRFVMSLVQPHRQQETNRRQIVEETLESGEACLVVENVSKDYWFGIKKVQVG